MEIRPNVFVGMLSKKYCDSLWSLVANNSVAALLYAGNRNGIGYELRENGEHKFRSVLEGYFPLISKQKSW